MLGEGPWRCIMLGLAALVACDAPAETEPADPAPQAGDEEPASAEAAQRDLPPRPEQAAAVTPVRAAPAQLQEKPLEIRVSKRAMMIYAEPHPAGAFRGKLPHGEAFAVFEKVAGDDCRGAGWARVGLSAYACLEDTVPARAKQTPVLLPHKAKGQITPYYYARLKRKDASGSHPHAPRWRSRAALDAGEPPIDELVPDHDYAFTYRRRSTKGTVLGDAFHRVVLEQQVRRLEPSEFEGHDAAARPLPADRVLAWSVAWPHAPIYVEPDLEAKRMGGVPLQVETFVTGESIVRRGTTFWKVAGERGGWLDGEQIRRFVPAPPPEGVGEDELWIDVELDQQTLAVWRGDALVFVTMVSTGNHKHPTPQGIYRIGTKTGLSDMDSQQGDDEPYAVEGVPWAQFFHGRYGLHGTFWHNRFGRRTSHGCVNLSAKDSARVFAMTSPRVLPGWIMAFEHPDEPGTIVRVRKLDSSPLDKRDALVVARR
jgi:hypothetical protein